MSELGKRVFTGVLGAPAVILLIVYGNWVLVFLAVTGLSLGMLVEYSSLTFQLSDRSEKKYALLASAWVAALLDVFMPRSEFFIFVLFFMLFFTYFLLTAKRFEGGQLNQHFRELAFSLFGFVYLVFLPSYFRKIYDLAHGVEWVIVFLLINWAGDTGAYFAGKKMGRVRLYPEISPKKTREGALAGLVAGLVSVLIFKWVYFSSVSFLGAVLLSLTVGVVAQVGDLCESFLKRAFNIKDSGALLPGHGGLLDRFDGVVFSLPVMYAGIRIFT